MNKKTVKGAKVSDLAVSFYNSPVGKIALIANPTHLVELAFINSSNQNDFADIKDQKSHPVLKQAKQELDQYFSGKLKNFKTPLMPTGTQFQLKAWKALLQIPYGKTLSYSDQAKKAGSPSAFRAVGSANGKNPLPIFIPCHRVLAKNSGLGGYSGGLNIKKSLLKIEGFLP